MNIIIVNQNEVSELLTVAECIKPMAAVLKSLASGECLLPLRQIMWLPEKIGALGLMPSYWGDENLIGLKAVTFFPGNEGTELDTHQGAVLLYEAKRGKLLAIIDATSITAIRTAAVSAVATKCLARQDATTLAIIGSGVQAQNHLAAMLACRDIKRVRVCSKTFDRAKHFAAEQSTRHNVEIEALATVQEAVGGADIICTATSASEPILQGDWLSPGTHINAIGSSVAFQRELDGAAVRKSKLYVDRRESALNEAGDFLLAKKDGMVDDDHIRGEIGEILTGKIVGRESPDDITLFKSVGLAVEDLAAAKYIYEKALERGTGQTIEFGGARHAAR